MNIVKKTLTAALVCALVPLAACGKGEIKDDQAPSAGASSAPAAGAGSAPAAKAEGGDKAAAGEKAAPAAGDAAGFDFAKYDALLKKYVTERGKVDYKGLKGDDAAMGDLKDAAKRVGTADISKMGRDAKLSFYINAYNVLTLKAVIDRYPIKSVMDVKNPDFFKGIKHKVAGEEMTLDVLENERIRGAEFGEARIHFVVNCASASCPRLRRDAITPANLEKELEAGAREYVLQETKVDAAKKVVDTSQIFNWFAADFKKSSGTVNDFLAKYMDSAQADTIKASTLTFHDYDWALNESK